MEPIWIIVISVVAFLLLGGLVAMFMYTYPISKKVYFSMLVRTDEEKWGRECSAPENEEQVAMWNSGVQWANKHKDKMREVQVRSDGFRLFGEYYDFNKDRCVIIIPGRCESLMYSYYFAPPYEEAGFNVLVIDTRCHGKSDGQFNTIGVKESLDVLKWSQLMHDEFGNKEIYYHGICIGTSSALFALSNENCPDYNKGLVTEGCFVTFRETFKRHMIYDHRPLFPVLDLVMKHINHYTGTNVYKDTPINAIKKVPADKRMLFLYGEKDVFSLPKKSQKLFDSCNAKDKKLVWFSEGGHSHLRINNTEKYDKFIIDFFN